MNQPSTNTFPATPKGWIAIECRQWVTFQHPDTTANVPSAQ